MSQYFEFLWSIKWLQVMNIENLNHQLERYRSDIDINHSIVKFNSHQTAFAVIYFISFHFFGAENKLNFWD